MFVAASHFDRYFMQCAVSALTFDDHMDDAYLIGMVALVLRLEDQKQLPFAAKFELYEKLKG